MEIILHFIYVVAISKTRAWEGSSPFQLSMISYFNLQIIWLKVPPLLPVIPLGYADWIPR